MKTRVSIDVSGLAWNYRTGVQNLFWAFVEAWAQSPHLNQNYELKFYDRSGVWNSKIESLVGDAYVSLVPKWFPTRLSRAARGLGKLGVLKGPELTQTINHVWNWDIYHCPGMRASITVPDILPLEYPQWFDETFQIKTKESLRFAKEEAEFVFVISHFIKQRLIDFSGISDSRISVVYPGIAPLYFQPADPETADSILKKHGLVRGRFLLSSGFLDPRKNLLRQVEAFKRYILQNKTDIKYALTGLRNNLSDELLNLIDTPEFRSKIVFLGYVPIEELKALMESSAALMYCSLAEGFGLPIIEAMAVGAHVITSSTTSMGELASGRARIVDPTDCDAIAQAIQATVDKNVNESEVRIRSNKEYARQFTIQNWLVGHLKMMAR